MKFVRSNDFDFPENLWLWREKGDDDQEGSDNNDEYSEEGPSKDYSEYIRKQISDLLDKAEKGVMEDKNKEDILRSDKFHDDFERIRRDYEAKEEALKAAIRDPESILMDILKDKNNLIDAYEEGKKRRKEEDDAQLEAEGYPSVEKMHEITNNFEHKLNTYDEIIEEIEQTMNNSPHLNDNQKASMKEYVKTLKDQGSTWRESLKYFKEGDGKDFYERWYEARKGDENPEQENMEKWVQEIECEYNSLDVDTTYFSRKVSDYRVFMAETDRRQDLIKKKTGGRGGAFMEYKSAYSILDLFMMLKKVVENVREKEKERREEAQAVLYYWANPKNPKAIKAYLEVMGKRREEWEYLFKGEPSYVLWEELDNIGKDEQNKARAFIEMLIDNGSFRFTDTRFHKVLAKLHSGFSLSLVEGMDEQEMIEYVQVFCEDIWGTTAYKSWKSKTTRDGRRGARTEYKELAERVRGNTQKLLNKMLNEWKAGTCKDEPIKYEALIEDLFIDPMLNGVPEWRMYYIVMGLTIRNPQGQTMLSPDSLGLFVGDSAVTMRLFTDDQSPKDENGRITPYQKADGKAIDNPRGVKRPWRMSDYRKWADMMHQGVSEHGQFDMSNNRLKKNMTLWHDTILMRSKPVLTFLETEAQKVSKGKIPHFQNFRHYHGLWSESFLMDALKPKAAGAKHGYLDKANWETFMGEAPDYFARSYEKIKELDEYYKHDLGWRNGQRKVYLKEIGKHMRILFRVFQIMQGKGEGQAPKHGPPQYINYSSPEDWVEKVHPKSKSLKKSYEGVMEVFDTYLDTKTKKGGKNYKDWAKNMSSYEALIKNEGGFFDNPDHVWAALEVKYGNAGN